jgi:hypothetical protein
VNHFVRFECPREIAPFNKLFSLTLNRKPVWSRFPWPKSPLISALLLFRNRCRSCLNYSLDVKRSRWIKRYRVPRS